VLVTALIVSLSAVTIGLARAQTYPVLDSFTDACVGKPQPCWNGIVPGMTTVDEMRQIMAYAGAGVTLSEELTDSSLLYFIPPPPSPICMALFELSETLVERVQLLVCKEADVKIGDLTGALGLPQHLFVVPPQNLVYGYITVNAEGWRKPVSPTSQVSYINLLQAPHITQRLFAWHGFVPTWRYCQLEPDYPLCK
jgi:hypothetical protein